MIRVSQVGIFRRPVIVMGPWAIKIARNEKGRRCNRYEADLYRTVSDKRRTMLCPVLWASPKGLILIMSAAKPLSTPLDFEEYRDIYEEWDYLPGEDGCPFEPKQLDWGWHKGCRVALDYSTPAWANED
jgi:hypothetical protein